MTELLALLGSALWITPTVDVTIDGLATYYNNRLMESVVVSKRIDLTGYKGPVVLNRKADLGRTVWLEWPHLVDTPLHFQGPYLSIDCAQQAHFITRETQRRIVEVSGAHAAQIGFYGLGPIPVVVWLVDPALTDRMR